jgi:hypothetical protein
VPFLVCTSRPGYVKALSHRTLAGLAQRQCSGFVMRCRTCRPVPQCTVFSGIRRVLPFRAGGSSRLIPPRNLKPGGKSGGNFGRQLWCATIVVLCGTVRQHRGHDLRATAARHLCTRDGVDAAIGSRAILKSRRARADVPEAPVRSCPTRIAETAPGRRRDRGQQGLRQPWSSRSRSPAVGSPGAPHFSPGTPPSGGGWGCGFGPAD